MNDPDMAQRRPRVMLMLKEYPQISQTYIKNEIEALEQDHDVTIVTRKGPDIPFQNARPHRYANTVEEFREIAEEVRPDILHTHYLSELRFIGALAERTGIPFTVRTHSFDTVSLRPKSIKGKLKQRLQPPDNPKTTWKGRLWRVVKPAVPLEKTPWFMQNLRAMDSDLCLGVLNFPCARPWLEAAGVRGDKLIDCFPVVRYRQFHDRGENGVDIMNTGVVTPKKAMGDFLKLASRVPDRHFRLYGLGYHVEQLLAKNDDLGARVEFVDPVQPEDMLAEYKKHRWLVYTADFDVPAVGWPMAVAEAQAAGVGVCMPRIRPDLEDYVGRGAGYLYDSIRELPDIIRHPVPPEMREAGFEQAKKSDIETHLHRLTDAWRAALPSRTQAPTPPLDGAEDPSVSTSTMPEGGTRQLAR